MNMYTPLLATEIYLIVSILLFRIGIWDFNIKEPIIFYTLLVFYHIAFIIGYTIAANNRTIRLKPSIFDSRNFLTILLIINIVIVILHAIRMGNLAVDGFNFINRLIIAIYNPSFGYKLKFSVTTANVFGGKMLTYILFTWGIVSYAIIPLGFYHYNSLKLKIRILFFLNIIVTIAGGLIIGTNKRIFDVTLALVLFWLLRQKKVHINSKLRKIKFALLIVIFMFFATFVIADRGFGSYWNSSTYKLGGVVSVNDDSLLLRIFPESMHSFWAVTCSYLCQGYYALSLAPLVTASPMFGLGSSLYLVDEFNLNKYTYQYAIEQMFGWDSRVQWASIYTWIANDIGLYGVIIAMGLIGFLFATIYKECIYFPNPVSYILMYYMAITIIFIPCNFQILQDPAGVIGVFFWGMLWVIKHFRISKHSHYLQ